MCSCEDNTSFLVCLYTSFIYTFSIFYSFLISLVEPEVEDTGYVMDGGYENIATGQGAVYENQNVNEVPVHPNSLYGDQPGGENLVV